MTVYARASALAFTWTFIKYSSYIQI